MNEQNILLRKENIRIKNNKNIRKLIYSISILTNNINKVKLLKREQYQKRINEPYKSTNFDKTKTNKSSSY